MKLAEQIRKLRKDNNFSQEEFARRLDVTRPAVSNWENEKNYPDLQTIVRISDEFDISLDKLLKGDVDVVSKITEDTKKCGKLEAAVKRHRKVAIALVLALIILAGICNVLFYGYTPVQSIECEIKPTVHYEMNDDGNKQTVVRFNLKLNNGKCIDARNRRDESDKDIRFAKWHTVYDQYKIPFDNRGKHPDVEEIYYLYEPSETDEENTVHFEFKDKTISFNLKEIVKKEQR